MERIFMTKNSYVPTTCKDEENLHSIFSDIWGEISVPQKHDYNFNMLKVFSPIRTYDNAENVFKAYHEATNNVTKALVLSGMASTLRKNADEMLKIISLIPESFIHADESLRQQKEFAEKAIGVNPRVYSVLPDSMKQDEGIVNSYVHSMCSHAYVEDPKKIWMDGCYGPCGNLPRFMDHRYKDGLLSLPSAIEACEIDAGCPKGMYYSEKNYQAAIENMIRNGFYSCRASDVTGHRDSAEVYSGYVLFAQEAVKAYRDDPTMMAKYKWAEAQAVINCIDVINQTIEKGPLHYGRARLLAEAVALASHTLENPSIELQQLGIKPQPERAATLLSIVEKSEQNYWIQMGQDLMKELDRLAMGEELRNYELERVDRLLEESEHHPEMQVSQEIATTYWSFRGEQLAELIRENEYATHNEGSRAYHNRLSQIEYLTELSQNHPEMRIGEQLEIDEFNQGERGHNH
jgi:hypothetical protein